MVVKYASWACTVIAVVVDNLRCCEPSSGNIAGNKACMHRFCLEVFDLHIAICDALAMLERRSHFLIDLTALV